jgi:integrase
MSGNWMAGCKPTRYSGIWKTKEGYRVRARAVDPRTGALKEANREYANITLEEALVRQAELKATIRRGRVEERERVRYAAYSEFLLKRKLAMGQLTSRKSRRTWVDIQDLHLVPAFGDWFVDEIRKKDIDEWLVEQGQRVRRGKFSPNTVNGWLRVLLTTMRAAVEDLDLPRDPTRGVRPIDTSTWHTYTEEEPNSLTVEEVPPFMAQAQKLFPQHYAMLALGLATGRRPCELRPLRRKGPSPDVLWDQGVLLIRRSEGLGDAVERTKTRARLRIPLPPGLMDILKWHVEHLPEGKMRDSDLLFPATAGGFRAGSCLNKPIVEAAKEAGIMKHLSPYFMRRTFQDLCRAAQVHDFVARAISGHATVEMQEHYSTVGGEEVRAGLAKVISLAGFRREHDESGYPGGYPNADEKKAG